MGLLRSHQLTWLWLLLWGKCSSFIFSINTCHPDLSYNTDCPYITQTKLYQLSEDIALRFWLQSSQDYSVEGALVILLRPFKIYLYKQRLLESKYVTHIFTARPLGLGLITISATTLRSSCDCGIKTDFQFKWPNWWFHPKGVPKERVQKTREGYFLNIQVLRAIDFGNQKRLESLNFRNFWKWLHMIVLYTLNFWENQILSCPTLYGNFLLS